MKKVFVYIVSVVLFALSLVPRAQATTLFGASLTGAQEVPPNASPGTGFGSVLLNDTETQITVNLSWSGLFAPAVAAHIHGPAAPGINAAVLFPLSGVPNATSGSIPEQIFAITSSQVSQLNAGLFYFNVHTGTFPGGEIRGQILRSSAPESSSILLLLTGFAGLGFTKLRGKVACRS